VRLLTHLLMYMTEQTGTWNQQQRVTQIWDMEHGINNKG
jgi:hypothetical protein